MSFMVQMASPSVWQASSRSCDFQGKASQSGGDLFAVRVLHNSSDSITWVAHPQRHSIDMEALNVGTLLQAANYLDIKGLLDVTCKTVANMIKGKTPEEIRKTFNIKNDFTEEEEAQVFGLGLTVIYLGSC